MVLNFLYPEDKSGGGLVTMGVNIHFVETRVARPFVRSLETSFSVMNRGIFVGLGSVSMRFLFHADAFLIKHVLRVENS
jgi:hypothetical protein